MSVETTIQSILDRVAKVRQGIQAVPTGNDFWTKIDGAGDETFENRVKGSDITTVDSTLAAASIWSNTYLKKLYTLISDYFRLDLDLSAPYWTTYIASVGWRVPYEAAEALAEALGTSLRLSSQYVFPKGTRVADEADPTSAGMHEFMRLTGTAGNPTELAVDGLISAYIKGSPILAINTTADITCTGLELTCTKQNRSSTVDVAYDHDQATQHTQGFVGEAAIGVGVAASGQKDVLIKTAVTQFAAGEWVLLIKSDYSVAEVAQIDSIDTLTLTMESNLINSWLENDLVLPMFTNCIWKEGTVSESDVLRFYAFPDRIIAL